MESLARRGDPIARAKLRAPLVPRRCLYLLERYFEFCEFRRVEAGPHGLMECPADWNDLSRFAEMTGHRLTRWERRVFRRIDNAYFAGKAPVKKKQAGDT